MAAYLDNPAGRLHMLLSALRDTPNPASTTTTEAWWRALGHSLPVDAARLLESLARVMDLAVDARVSVERLNEEDPDVFLRWRGKVDAALGASLSYANAPVANVLTQYDEATLAQLESLSYELHRRAAEQTLSDERLWGLREDVQAVLDEVLADEDLDSTLRGYVAEHLRSVLAALDEYKIRGVEAITAAVDRAYGHVVRDHNVQAGFLDHPHVWEKVRDVLAAVAAAATITTAVLQLTSGPSAVPSDPGSQVTIVEVVPSGGLAVPPGDLPAGETGRDAEPGAPAPQGH